MLPPPMSSSATLQQLSQTTVVPCEVLSTLADSQNNATKSPADMTTQIANAIWIYMSPIIFFIGLAGNILILVVMSRARMRGTSTSSYLIIMAVADLLTVTTGIVPEWLDAMGIFSFQTWNPASCKIYKFVSYACGDTATWIRVLFTLDRFMAICFPLKKSDCCLPGRAKFYCLGAALAAIAKNMHVFWTRGAEYETKYVYEYVDCVSVKTNQTVTTLKNNCGYPKPEYRYFEIYVRPWIVFTLVNLIPFCIILVCNIFIIRAMILMKRVQEERNLTRSKGSERHLLQTTTMCLAASFAFLICVTPTMVLLIGKPYWTKDGSGNMAYEIAKSISNQMLYIINSINFFLYCITGKKFRETLAMVFCCRYSDARKNSSAPHSTVRRPASAVTGKRKSTSSANSDWSGPPRWSKSSSGLASRQNSCQTPNVEGEVTPFSVRGANLAQIAEVILEEKTLPENNGDSRSLRVTDAGEDGLEMTHLSEETDEQEIKNKGLTTRRNRTESESSSGISSSTSSHPHSNSIENSSPEFTQFSIQEHDPIAEDCFIEAQCIEEVSQENSRQMPYDGTSLDHCNDLKYLSEQEEYSMTLHEVGDLYSATSQRREVGNSRLSLEDPVTNKNSLPAVVEIDAKEQTLEIEASQDKEPKIDFPATRYDLEDEKLIGDQLVLRIGGRLEDKSRGYRNPGYREENEGIGWTLDDLTCNNGKENLSFECESNSENYDNFTLDKQQRSSSIC